MKTIQVNGETWERAYSCGMDNPKLLHYDGAMYLPQKKEITLEDIRKKGLSHRTFNAPFYRAGKLGSIIDMILVADYLNEGWEPDWSEKRQQKYILISLDDTTRIEYWTEFKYSFCYFKDEETAKRAIKILGVETIKTALS